MTDAGQGGERRDNSIEFIRLGGERDELSSDLNVIVGAIDDLGFPDRIARFFQCLG